MDDKPRYPVAAVQELVERVAAAAGVPPPDAAILADALVEADLQGGSTHGVSRLNIYVRRIQRGLVDPAAELCAEKHRPAISRFRPSRAIRLRSGIWYGGTPRSASGRRATRLSVVGSWASR